MQIRNWTFSPAWAARRPALSALAPWARWDRVLEYLLVALLVVQIVRLLWTVVTPAGPVGDWTGRNADIPPAAQRGALFAAHDLFFPAAPVPSAGGAVTSLPLTLFGLRVNEATGQGSAIIAGPDGVQASYAVGEEVSPGVVLKAVEFDHVVLSRGGVDENLYIDQSGPTPQVAQPAEGRATVQAEPPVAAASGAGLTPGVIRRDIGLSPRQSGGQVTGLLLNSRGPGFAEAGFRPGDVIVEVNGRPVRSVSDMAALQQSLAPGARISLQVERGASVVPIALILPEQ